jgi:hypothetical protein
VEPTVEFLAELAGGRPALEFGVGTGRIAMPLHERGIPVHGIELSTAMAARLAEKPGAGEIGVTIGDFASTKVGGTFGLVYLLRNTIMNLTSQDEQVACFCNAAAHLEAGGVFVVEVMVPELQRLPPGDTVRAFTITASHLGFDEYDVANQGLVSHHYWVLDDRLETFSARFRYAWPAELDLMAQIAGMRLRDRWSNWHREPFSAGSREHISVWEKTDS